RREGEENAGQWPRGRSCRRSCLPSPLRSRRRRCLGSHRREPWLSAPPSELLLHSVAVCVLGKIRFKRYGCIESFLEKETSNPSWKLSLPHVLVGTLSSFLFGYHLGVVNEPLESISRDLGFRGNTLAEGLVVSMCLGGALIGSLFSGWIADAVGCRRAFRLCALPMIIGASMSAAINNLFGMLVGWLFVGTGLGLGPPAVALYVTEA
ncbi:probable plastidic glucose transporter 2, partial [Arachis hypogaea]|uniref:probable plastidic glucose transporter 2 n=1 Tax=Arachis hypogaea TaxID=3818 RepID=UPI003B20F6A8